MKKEILEKRLYEKMHAEQKQFLEELRAGSVEDVISKAYEIAFRNNVLFLFENETALALKELEILLEMEHPLAELYAEWLSTDTNEMQNLQDCIQDCAVQIMTQQAEELYRSPETPVYRKTDEEAIAAGEYLQWKANRERNQLCVQMFQEEAGTSYRSRKFPQFLRRWVDVYGQERCLYVLSMIVADRKTDSRIGKIIREKLWSENTTTSEQNRVRYKDDKVLSCTVNKAAESLLYSREQYRKKEVRDR